MRAGDLIRVKYFYHNGNFVPTGGTFVPTLGIVLDFSPNLAGKFLRIRLLRSSGDVREFTSDNGGYEVISEGG